MEKNNIFSYYWHIDEKEKEVTSIRVYGLDEENRNICLRIDNFTPYIYIELPNSIVWSESSSRRLGAKIDDMMRNQKPLQKCLVLKHKLYGVDFERDGSRKKYPYMFCSFSSREDIKTLTYKLNKPIAISGLSNNIRLKVHEQDADPILQLVSLNKVPTAGWISFIGKPVAKAEQVTLCDEEYKVKYNNLKKLERNTIANPKIMGFDIEVNSSNPSAMPKAEKMYDKVFQISCVFMREGDDDNIMAYLLTLGDPLQEVVGDKVIIQRYDTEYEILEGFSQLIRSENPNVIVGYNILSFDIPYMIARSKVPCLCSNFDKQGFHKDNRSKEKTIKWSSSAFKNQEFQFLDAEGRLFVDLLPLIQREYKMDNYKLKTVSDFFLGDTKDPLSVKGIFKCYRVGTKRESDGSYSKRARKAMGIVGKYCVQDSVLVVKLMSKLKTWVGLTEQATTYNTSIFSIYTQGQQIKVYSQVYKYCLENNFVVEKDGYIASENEKYMGAHVFPPTPGIYDRVLPLDFASLYPSVIIAYNIDFSTLVTDESIPDSKCHVMRWTDACNCIHDPKVIRKEQLTKYIDKEKKVLKELREKRDNRLNKHRKQEYIDEINKKVEELKPYMDERSKISKTITKNVICGERYYRFIKEPKGVIPTILQNLLDARKNTRNEIKRHNKEIENSDDENIVKNLKMLNNVLDKRQSAYKVSANSVASTTPIPCKVDGLFIYKTIEEISKGDWKRINDEQEVSTPIDNLEVWSDMGFTKPKFVMRHPKTENLFRVNTHTGCVDCTGDHSLLRNNGQEVKPKDLKLGDDLLHQDFPLPADTPHKPLFLSLSNDSINDYPLTSIEEEEAFVHGVFFAEGTCGTWGVIAKTSWIIYNQDLRLLERCKNILNKVEDEHFEISYESASVYHLKPKISVRNVSKKYRDIFYDKRKYKKFPDYIFNAPFKVRQAFFMGYYNGDGNRHLDVGIVIQNKGGRGCASLFYLTKSLGYRVSVSYSKDKNAYRLQCCTEFRIKKVESIKRIEIISQQEEKFSDSIEYVYDIETENHHFAAGVGNMIVHNSMYGAWGVKKGYLPFMAGAMTTTFMGRTNIEIVAKTITEKHGGHLVYGDTDSNYVHFPHLKTAEESWDYALQVAEDVSSLFPPPIKLEFEEAIYWRFFILTKKRYMYKSCGRDGIVSNKIGKKGVLLARRDSSVFVRKLYEQIIMKIFDNVPSDDILFFILEELNKLCSNTIPYKEFVITKAVGDTNNMTLIPYIDEKGVEKTKIGDYIVPLLPTDEKERLNQLKKKDVMTDAEYYEKCLPAQVQLAEKMRHRGQIVQSGSRLEFLITDIENHDNKQYEKIENIDYFLNHSDVLTVDFFYYIKVAINSIDEVLNIAFAKNEGFKKDFILEQYNFRYKLRRKVIDEIKKMTSPTLIFC